MSYFNMVCDSCGREVYGCNIVNGMKFCAKCYQETFGETDKDKQIEELQNKLAKQLEWIENNKNKAKNCAIQMNNQAKEITRLKQSNKDLMRVIWNTKRERAKKGREICKANNYMIAKDKQIAELQKQLKSQPAEIVEKIRNICSIEDKCKDGSFVLGINEKDLDNLLKEYQK